MLSNYLKIAWRNLKRQKLFSLLNLLGLAIGMAACLLILEYVQYERGYDSFHSKKDRIFRLGLNRFSHGEMSTQWAGGAAGAGFQSKEHLPEVEAFTTFRRNGGLFSYGEKHIGVEKIYHATDEVFKVFDYHLIEGDPETALTKPNTIVLTESLVKRFFEGENPMGKTITLHGDMLFTVTGVMKDLPSQTHLPFEALTSFQTFIEDAPNVVSHWMWDGFLSYVLLAEDANPEQFVKKLDQLVIDQNGEVMNNFDEGMKFFLQPLEDIHLTSNYMAEAEANGDGQAVQMLSLIAIFILLIAWINYINLSTARSIRRAREVGLRKTTGASNGQLVSQFLLESFFINLIAGVLALTFYQLFRPYLIEISGTPIEFSFWHHPYNWMIFLAMLVGGSFLAGLYPAFVLSSFQPAVVLKGKLNGGRKGMSIRKGLVIFQFAISSLLVAGTLAVYQQLTYMQNQELGISLDQTLIVRGPMAVDSTYRASQNVFHEKLERNPKISDISSSSSVPGDPSDSNAGGIRMWGQPESDGQTVAFMWMDDGFVDLFGIEVVAGRNFRNQMFADSGKVLINESAVTLLGFNSPEEILGKDIHFWGRQEQVVGVLADYHHKSLKETGRPTVYRYWPYLTSYHSMRVSTTDLAETISFIEKNFREQFPENPFEYYFGDEYFGRQYSSDQKFSKVFGAFSILAILIACLGLFGLASYALSRRAKEMGIRKVLGASISQLTVLISKDFILLILIANVIALPLAGWGISQWLLDFPYQMQLTWTLFALPFFLILLVALLTISSQTFKAAHTNPVDALRNE